MCINRKQRDVLFEWDCIFAFVASRNSLSASWCLISVPCTTLKSNSDSWRCYRGSQPMECAKFKTHFSASWSVRIVNRWTSNFVRKRWTDYTIARRLR